MQLRRIAALEQELRFALNSSALGPATIFHSMATRGAGNELGG
jgi:hypothetical protein